MNISSQMSSGIRSGHTTATGSQPFAFPVIIYAAQPNSTLLYKLSAELRLMIWEYAIGYHDFHIFLNHNKLCHRVCNPKIWKNVREGQAFTNFFLFRRISLPPPATANAYGRNSTPSIERSGERMRSRPGSFLCTCKQMYHESIDILYTTNTFIFSTAWLIPSFSASITTAHWQKLRSIKIFLSSSGYQPQEDNDMTSLRTNGSWHTIHPLISSLPNLLSCEIYAPSEPSFHGNDSVGTREFEWIGRPLLDFFTTRRCKGKIKDLQVYVPIEIQRVEDIKEEDNSSHHRVWRLHLLGTLQRQLKEKGVHCKVLPGGVAFLREEK